ncbi:MAG: nucleoside hydrolase [Planctomycetota bacterium]
MSARRTTRLVLTDAGIDDALALIFLAEILSGGPEHIVCNGGNISADRVANNCAFLRDVFGWEAQLYLGSNPPYQSECDAANVHGRWGLGERCPPAVDLPPFDDLRSTLQNEAGPIDILVLGPSTDLPELLSWSAVKDRVGKLTLMGGTFGVEGNITPYAEFNVYMDPDAADDVMGRDSGALWVPLDVTRGHLYTREEILSGFGEGERGRIVRELYDFAAARHRELGAGNGVYLHDVLAAAAWLGVVDVTEKRARVRTVTRRGDKRGRIMCSDDAKGGHTVRYAADADHGQLLNQWGEVCAKIG